MCAFVVLKTIFVKRWREGEKLTKLDLNEWKVMETVKYQDNKDLSTSAKYISTLISFQV